MSLARWIATLLCLGVVGSGMACRRAAEQNEFRVGLYTSLTGGTATFGRSAHNGVKLASEEINTRGGVLGRPVNLIVEDDQGKPEEAKLAVLKLIRQHKVTAILGEVASSRTLAAAPEAQRTKIPMLTPTSTNATVTKVGDYIFRACFIDSFQGGAMATFARQELKVSKAAILHDARSDYSVGLAEFFRKSFTRQGGEVLADEAFAEGDVDFRAQLVAIQAKQPEAIFIPGYYTEVGLIARQARELGITATLLGTDGWDSPKTLEIAGPALEGSYFSNHYAADDPSPLVHQFITTYQARFGQIPDAIAALSYDAAHLLFDATQRAGKVDSTKIRDALAATKGFPGVAGAITIDRERNAEKPIVIIKIAHGAFVFDRRITDVATISKGP
ncbi:MAG: ABC transporter substrate-binding protein [Deltaproteobacteria bacterium]|nr:ABC transporter substrate-binding protein [Deltaproteobacteria bacterium]